MRFHWDRHALRPDPGPPARAYHRWIEKTYRGLISPGRRILDVGCGNGDLLAALRPGEGVGIELSPRMAEVARHRHPELRIVEGDVLDAEVTGPFDVVVLSDVVDELWDVQAVFERVGSLATTRTRVFLSFPNRLWRAPLGLARRLGLARPSPGSNRLTVEDVGNLLCLSGFEVLGSFSELLVPHDIPPVSGLANRFLARVPPFSAAAIVRFVIARPLPGRGQGSPRVSVIVPARNEAGNVAAIVSRVPEMGSGTELVFVEGGSADGTWEEIEKVRDTPPGRSVVTLKQPGRGKADAVRAGFRAATGDVLMILDADLTTAPEDLPRFLTALVAGTGEFVNGVRLVYPSEKGAMPFVNSVGNRFFRRAVSWLLGQRVGDTMCGTKALWARHWRLIEAERPLFGDIDPFGDFELLLGAARAHLKIVDLPVRYGKRTYGSTSTARLRHGWLLLRFLAIAAFRTRFT